MSASAKVGRNLGDIRVALGAQVSAHLGIALDALKEQADLDTHHRAHHIDQAVALIRGDATFLKVAFVRVAIRHAPVRDRLDAAHDDGLEVQELDAHALIDLERDTRRVGTVRHQARSRMERGGIGILILKTTGIGNQATEQTGGDAIANDNAAIIQKAVDDHGARRSIDTPQAYLGKLLARRMVIEAHHMFGAAEHLGGVVQTLDDRHVHRDEQIRIAGIRRCRHQTVGALHKAVDARNRVIVCQQQGNVLVGEKLHKR